MTGCAWRWSGKKWFARKWWLSALLTGMITLLLSGKLFAQVTTTHFQPLEENGYLWCVKETDRGGPFGEAVTFQAEVSAEGIPCETRTDGEVSGEELFFRTVILLDNSLSIHEGNREKIKILLQKLIRERADREQIALYTFSETPELVAEGDDTESLLRAVDEIRFMDQDSFLADCLAEVLVREGRKTREAGLPVYSRLILISDGADDNPAGKTYADLLDLLEEDAYRCPIYTLESVWEKDRSGLKNLRTLSERNGGMSFVLDETEDMGVITEAIASDHRAGMAVIRLPLELCDGSERTLRMTGLLEGEPFELVHTVETPALSAKETVSMAGEALATETESEIATGMEIETETGVETGNESRKETKNETENNLEEARQEPVTEQAAQDKGSGFWKIQGPPRILLGAAGIAVIGGIWLAVYLGKRAAKRRKEDLHREMRTLTWQVTGEAAPTDPGQMPGQREEGARKAPPHMEGLGDSEKTVGLWDEGALEQKGVLLTLTDVNDPGRRFRVTLRSEVTIGRDSLCTVVISQDRTVSAMHCRIIRLGDDVLIEDLRSHNGTVVNGRQIRAGSWLHTGDVIELGRTILKVTIGQ